MYTRGSVVVSACVHCGGSRPRQGPTVYLCAYESQENSRPSRLFWLCPQIALFGKITDLYLMGITLNSERQGRYTGLGRS